MSVIYRYKFNFRMVCAHAVVVTSIMKIWQERRQHILSELKCPRMIPLSLTVAFVSIYNFGKGKLHKIRDGSSYHP